MLTVLARVSALLLGAVAVAQSPLTTTFANNNGGAVGGGVYFDLTINVPSITITQIDLNATGTAAVLDVLTIPGTRVGSQTNVAAWTGPSSLGNAFTALGAGQQSVCTLTAPLVLPAGTWGIAFRANGFSHSYTNGNGTNQTYSNAELTLNAGEASNVAFAGGLFSPRVVNCNIHYTIGGGGGGTVALRQNYGTGCVSQFNSFYENFATSAALDLGNSAMSMIYSGNGYSVLPGITSFVAPSATATNLALTDDSQAVVNLSAAFPYPGGTSNTLNVCSNGFISVGGNGTGFTPAVATMLNNANIGWYCWHDYLPNATNNVMFEEVGGIAYITWNGVPDFGATGSSNTFQFQVDVATGNVHFVWQAMSGLGNGHLVGYSLGGASVDPGNRDISATLPGTFAVAATDILPLAFAASARPVTTTSINLDTTNVPAGAPFGAVLLGITQFNPGIPLAGLGMPGCFQYNDGVASLLFFPAGTTGSVPFNVPNAVGVQIFAQSAVFAPAAGLTPLGAISSNGVALTIGNL